MKTLKILSIVLLAMTTLSCSKEDEPTPEQTEKWLVSKEHITVGNMQNTAVYIYNDKDKPLQIKFYDHENILLNTESYTYDTNNFLIKWENDKVNSNQDDTRYEITNDTQGRRILEKYYINNVLQFSDESTFTLNHIIIVKKNPNGDYVNTTTIDTDFRGNYLGYVVDDNNPNTPNSSVVYSNYDNNHPLPRWRYFGLLSYEGLPNNPGREIKKSGDVITTDSRYEYQYNTDGYVTVMKKYNNLDNSLISTTIFDLVKQ